MLPPAASHASASPPRSVAGAPCASRSCPPALCHRKRRNPVARVARPSRDALGGLAVGQRVQKRRSRHVAGDGRLTWVRLLVDPLGSGCVFAGHRCNIGTKRWRVGSLLPARQDFIANRPEAGVDVVQMDGVRIGRPPDQRHIPGPAHVQPFETRGVSERVAVIRTPLRGPMARGFVDVDASRERGPLHRPPPLAARTIATMPARSVSGRPGHDATTSARSGSLWSKSAKKHAKFWASDS
jgi:hypothetical protein